MKRRGEHPGSSLIPEKLKPYLDMTVMYSLLGNVMARCNKINAGESIFDYMTYEEYAAFNRMMDDAVAKLRSNV